jgi:hypothetical protein
MWDLAQQYDKLIGLPDPISGPDELEAVWGGIRFVLDQTFALNEVKDADGLISAMNEDVQMVDRVQVDEKEWSEVCTKPGFDLVIIDTLRAIHQRDENDNKQMQDVMNLIRYLMSHTRAAVVLLHHFNKEKGERSSVSLDRLRGASAIAGAIDGVFALARPARNSEVVQVSVLKNRAAPHMRDFQYYQREHPDTGRVELTLSGARPGTANFTLTTVQDALRGAKGAWLTTAVLNRAVCATEGARDPSKEKLESAGKRVNGALSELERQGLIQRQHGKSRCIPIRGVKPGRPDESKSGDGTDVLGTGR